MAEGPREELEEHPDQEAVIEGLKSICNVLLHSETGLVGRLCLALNNDAVNAADLNCSICGDDRQRQPTFS